MSLNLNTKIPELDYYLLKHLVNDRKFVRNAILNLLRNSTLVRVKKGVYVNTNASLPSRGILANMIYGPSYVSQEYALYHYGLITEQPKIVTSMTLKMRRSFDKTPYGVFSYEQIKKERFFVGTTRASVDEQRGFVIATPEKALCDKFSRLAGINTQQDALNYCTEDLRIEVDDLCQLSTSLLKKIKDAFCDKSVDNLYTAIKDLKRN